MLLRRSCASTTSYFPKPKPQTSYCADRRDETLKLESISSNHRSRTCRQQPLSISECASHGTAVQHRFVSAFAQALAEPISCPYHIILVDVKMLIPDLKMGTSNLAGTVGLEPTRAFATRLTAVHATSYALHPKTHAFVKPALQNPQGHPAS